MSKIQCPHCGKWQEAYPYIVICSNCYADVTGIIEEHFKGRTRKGTAKAPEQSKQPSWVTFWEPRKDKGALLRKVWASGKGRSAGQGLRLSGPGVILKQTFETFFKRFWPLYPLVLLSLSFLMVTGVFASIMGLRTIFPEEYPVDPSMTLVFAVGIGACLFVFLYGQAAFVFAVVNRELTLSDALSSALQRFASYAALAVFMVVVVGIGTAMLLIPGVVAAILLSFAPFILAKENVGFVAAVSKSVRYVAGSWLQIFLRLAPVGLAVLLAWFFYVYAGVPILMMARNEFAFIFIISGLMSVPIMVILIFVFTIYEDLRQAQGLAPIPEEAPQPSGTDVAVEAEPAPTGLLPFTELLGRSWTLYKNRFATLTVLNIVSFLPHAIHIGMLLVGYLGFKWFFEAFQATGEFGLLVFLILPGKILVLLIAGAMIYLGIYVLAQISGVALYLLLELAYVYALADETLGAWGAIREARKRLGGFFWAQFYRNFIVSTGGALLFPGAVFWVWYEFTPFVFALQREEETPLSSLWESRELVRGLWGTVFGKLVSLRVLPLAIVAILVSFVFAGLPFYWLFSGFLFPFLGRYLPAMFAVYGPHFWLALYFWFFVAVGGFYQPFQKVALYLLYGDLKDAKAARGDQPARL